MSDRVYDVIIIGSGPAGYTAAIYSARANLRVLQITGTRAEAGGQLMLTGEVENYPGFAQGVQGIDLMTTMKEQAIRFDVEMITDRVNAVALGQRPFKVEAKGETYLATSVIIATGAQAQWLGLENEKRLIGKGVSACATCDAFFFKDLSVVVVGGGDSAMEEALALAKFATKVTVVHRRDSLRASKIMQKRALDHPKIDFIWNSSVIDVLGKDKVTGVRIKNLLDNKEKEIASDGFFVAIGHLPATELFKGQLDIDERGYLITTDQVKTSVSGVFAAGDVVDFRYRQAITAAADGCRAALEAEKFIIEG